MGVTIGIPFFNNEVTLADAIQSVFAQTYRDWELILVDDGSTDGSLEIARSVKDPRVRVISDGLNKRLPHRLNQIARLAREKYIARMDADDLMHPDRLTKQVLYLEENPEADLVGTGMYSIETGCTPRGVRSLGVMDTNPSAVLMHGAFVHVSVTGRTRWFRSNPYDGSFLRAEDHELWCRTCRRSVFAKLPEPLVFVREVESINIKKYLQSCRTQRKIFRRYGPSMVGRMNTTALMIQSYLKEFIYIAFTYLGAQSVLVRRRNARINKMDQAAAIETIQNILRTPVPGLSFKETGRKGFADGS